MPQFRKDIKRMKKRGKPIAVLWKVAALLMAGSPVNDDKELLREWEGHRGCKIDADWILIYKIEEPLIVLTRTGTHDDLYIQPEN